MFCIIDQKACITYEFDSYEKCSLIAKEVSSRIVPTKILTECKRK